MSLDAMSILIIIGYLLAIIITGGLVGRRLDLDGFLVNSRSTPGFLLVASMVSTNVGAATVIAVAAESYKTGISFGLTASGAVVGSLIVMAIVAPKLKTYGDTHSSTTIGEVFGSIYSRGAQVVSGSLVFAVYVLLTAAQFLAMSSLLHQVVDIPSPLLLVLSSVAMILYTAWAGIKSDLYTDAIHFVVMLVVLIGILIPLVLADNKVLDGLKSLPKELWNPFNYGGVVFFVGGVLFGIPLSLVSMEMWQRIFAAKDEVDARKVFLGAIVVSLPFLVGPILLGLSGRVLLGSFADAETVLYSTMSLKLHSAWFGVGLAAIIAVILSTANSMMMVSGATLARDIVIPATTEGTPLRTKVSGLTAARIATLCAGGFSLALAMIAQSLVTLLLTAFYGLMILVPSIIGGLFYNVKNPRAVFWSITSGIAVTLLFAIFMPKESFVPGTIVSAVVYWLVAR